MNMFAKWIKNEKILFWKQVFMHISALILDKIIKNNILIILDFIKTKELK